MLELRSAYRKARTQERAKPAFALIGFILSFFMQIAGLICSIIAYKRCKDNPELEGKTMALAGILISSIIIGLGVLFVGFWIALVIGIISSLPIEPNPGELARVFMSLI